MEAAAAGTQAATTHAQAAATHRMEAAAAHVEAATSAAMESTTAAAMSAASATAMTGGRRIGRHGGDHCHARQKRQGKSAFHVTVSAKRPVCQMHQGHSSKTKTAGR
jgi:hypothetical protein